MIKKNYVTSLLIAAVILQDAGRSYSAEPTALEQAKTNIRTLIKAGDYQAAKAATTALVTQFAGEPQLPAALNYVANEYRWVRDYNDATTTYQQVIEQYASSPAATRARLGLAEIDVVMLIDAGRYDEARDRAQELIAAFYTSPDLPETVYWLAMESEGHGRYDAARELYNYVATAAPDGKYAEKARFYRRAYEAFSLVESGKDTEAFACIDRLIADYPDSGDMALALSGLGWKYYADHRAENYLQKAIVICDKALTSLRPSQGVVNEYPYAHYLKGLCYIETGDDLRALGCFERVIGDYPDFTYGAHCQYMVGAICYKMKGQGLLTAAEADPRIKAALETLLSRYPGSDYQQSAEKLLQSLRTQ